MFDTIINPDSKKGVKHSSSMGVFSGENTRYTFIQEDIVRNAADGVFINICL